MKITIVGAGFSGLTLAHYLVSKGFEIEVVEANERPGGLISTKNTAHGLVETAATSILLTPKLEKLLSEIKLKPLLANKESKKRFISKNHIPRRLPLGLKGCFALCRGIMRLMLNKSSWAPQRSESLSSWGDRTFSKEVRKALISPAMKGIYADSAQNLSASLVLGKLFKKGKRVKSKGAINFENGMGEFIYALEKDLKQKGVKFLYGQKISKDSLPSHPVIMATSMTQAREFFSSIPKLPSKNMTSATLFFKGKPPIEGFGILFPDEEGLNAHGVLLNDCMFKNRSLVGHSETWILSEVQDFSEKEIIQKIKNDRIQLFKDEESPLDFSITTWTEAFPIYSPLLESHLEKKIELPENIYLTGNYLGNLGLSGILEQNSDLSETLVKELQ